MDENNTLSQEIAGAEVKIGNEKCRMALTGSFVGIYAKKGIFREAISIIPLRSIDSIFLGWARFKFFLYVGILFVIAGALMWWQEIPYAGWVLTLGAISLLVFWFWRPRLLVVRSVKEVLAGKYSSDQEAKNFIAVVTDAIAKNK